MFENECDVVLDLLPLYIENKTSDESNRLVRKHLEECRECSEIYRSMTADLSAINIPKDGFKRKRSRHIVRADVLIIGICITLYAAALCGFICWLFSVLTAGIF